MYSEPFYYDDRVGYFYYEEQQPPWQQQQQAPPRKRRALIKEEDPQKKRVEIRYINLAQRHFRRLGLEARLRSAGLRGTRFEATTGDDAPEAIVTRYWDSRLNSVYDKTTLPHPRVPLTPGERGCAMSHACLWAACAARSDDGPPLVVLEDDVEFAPNFSAFLERAIATIEATFSPSDRSLLVYLGADVAAWSPPRDSHTAKLQLQLEAHAFFDQETEPLAIKLLSADYLWQTSSYIIWPRAARALVAELPISEPVDNFISRHILTGHVVALVSIPFLCRQLNAYNDGDIHHSRPLLACHDPRLSGDDVDPAPILHYW